MSNEPFDGVSNGPPSSSGRVSLSGFLSGGTKLLASKTGVQAFALLSLLGFVAQFFTVSATVQFVEQLGVQSAATDSALASDAPTLGLPLTVLIGVPIVGSFVALTVQIGVIRSYVTDELDGFQSETVARDLFPTLLKAVAGNIVLTLGFALAAVAGFILLGVGLLLTIPLYWTVTVFFLQELVVADKGVFESISDSVSTTKGHRSSLLFLGVVLIVLSVPSTILQQVNGLPWLLTMGLQTVISQALLLFSVGAITEAWVRIKAARDGNTGPGSSSEQVSDQYQDGDDWVEDSDDGWVTGDDEWNDDSDSGWS